jgi:hypothetical protein
MINTADSRIHALLGLFCLKRCGTQCNLERVPKGGVTRATKLLQRATKSDFNACYVEMSTHVAL